MVIALQITCQLLPGFTNSMYSVKASMHQKFWPLRRGVGRFVFKRLLWDIIMF